MKLYGFDEDSGYIVPTAERWPVRNEHGGSCTFAAVYDTVLAHNYQNDLPFTYVFPQTYWSDYLEWSGQTTQNPMNVGVHYSQAFNYFSQKKLIPPCLYTRCESGFLEMEELMRKRELPAVLCFYTYPSFTEDFTFDFSSAPSDYRHLVSIIAFDKKYIYCKDNRGRNSHEFLGSNASPNFLPDGGYFRIEKARDLCGSPFYYDCAVAYFISKETEWDSMKESDKNRIILIARGKVRDDDPSNGMITKEEAIKYMQFAKDDPNLEIKKHYNIYLNEVMAQ